MTEDIEVGQVGFTGNKRVVMGLDIMADYLHGTINITPGFAEVQIDGKTFTLELQRRQDDIELDENEDNHVWLYGDNSGATWLRVGIGEESRPDEDLYIRLASIDMKSDSITMYNRVPSA